MRHKQVSKDSLELFRGIDSWFLYYLSIESTKKKVFITVDVKAVLYIKKPGVNYSDKKNLSLYHHQGCYLSFCLPKSSHSLLRSRLESREFGTIIS